MSSEAVFRMRIVSADYYSAAPNPQIDVTYNHFRGSIVKQLPIIRIFGITPTGEKACIHVHGVYPYLYVPFPNAPKSGSLHYEVAESLDEALGNNYGGKKHYVSKVTTVSAKPFYGYHSCNMDFLRIEFYHPSYIKRAITLLLGGAICNQVLQPHEAHIPYILQFFIDYNLYGMNFINLSNFTHRSNHESSNSAGPFALLTKVTKCAVEVDATHNSILNPQSSSRVLNPGLSDIREEEVRRHEEDGVPLLESTPADSRDFQPTPSDIRFREQLKLGLEERRKAELSGEAGNRHTTVNSQLTAPVEFDTQDISVLKVLFNRLVGDDLPDEDSVLGFTPEDYPDEAEPDLSQPYVSFIEEDHENVNRQEVNLSETLVWPELDGLSQIQYEEGMSPPLYVDGNMDDDKTPEKIPRKTRSKQSPRYMPLDVKLHKSPRRMRFSRKNVEEPSSPELFKKLENDASSLRNIKSPKVEATLAVPGTSSCLDEGPDIIGDSDDSDGEDSQRGIKYKFLDKSKALLARKMRKKKSTRRVLFTPSMPEGSEGENSSSSRVSTGNTSRNSDGNTSNEILPLEIDTECGSVQVKVVQHELPKETYSRQDIPLKNLRNCMKLGENEEVLSTTLVDVKNDENSVETCIEIEGNEEIICKAIEHHASDSTDGSENSIISFYGDTTIGLSPLSFNTVLTPLIGPPDPMEIASNLHIYGLDKKRNDPPFYGDPRDTSSSKEVGLDVVSLKSKCANDLEEFNGYYYYSTWPKAQSSKTIVILEPAFDPPSSSSVIKELEVFSQTSSISSAITSQTDSQEKVSKPQPQNNLLKSRKKKIAELDRRKRQSGEIEHATPDNSGMFKLEFQNLQNAQIQTLHKFTTVMVLEVHATTRANLRPDPDYDAIEAVFYVISCDEPSTLEEPSRIIGVIMVAQEDSTKYPYACSIEKVNTELELFSALIKLTDLHDPDIIAGYEIEMLSWGYLIERGFVLGMNLNSQLSRLKPDAAGNDTFVQEKFSNRDYDLKIPGRVVLNVWRLMRHEVALMSYTFESIAYHVLHTRVPKFSFKTLTYWWNHISKLYRHLVLKYYLTMVDGIDKLLYQLNLVGRTCELASLFGIQFYEVFSRGSQFRVESMMLRLARRLGFVAVSPSVEQRAHMRAPESLPLIMEPKSRFYPDPVIVLDFQSLYPSMIIAYNYCFSTCLGRVSSLLESSEFKFGCTELNVPLKELLKLEKNLHVSPAGVVFVDKSIRHGVLPQMLEEILETRLMVKSSLKRHKKDKLLNRVLDARQLGLKLIANVTYGYTSANFSGRMPCIEVGDSVVSKGRETLERAIRLVEGEKEWRVRVVYGDTDSLFVLCPGRSKEEAFEIGQQIADRVTAANPVPVKLKLEKVYQPCILQTKKRYAGFMYESADQKTPVYDAKGIETVRRDGCPAASKILEKSLKLLFETSDVSVVKEYVVQQMTKVLSARLNPAELTFAKEYRGASGYQPNAPVPALKIAREQLARDRRGEPRSGERVGYVVVCGPPGLPLINLVRSVPDFLARPTYVLNADYYISKAILPPLARCFTLLGADVFQWYANLPRKKLLNLQHIVPGKSKATIAQYFRTIQCLACGSLTALTLCDTCRSNPSNTLAILSQSVSKLERKQSIFKKICESCCTRNYETDCVSLDCPIFYRRLQAGNDGLQSSLLYDTILEISEF